MERHRQYLCKVFSTSKLYAKSSKYIPTIFVKQFKDSGVAGE
ncbi:hypothetical protein [Clostridium sp. OS1-26]|nr:hypothetical protein [Clostridium sp. OS1-26]WML34273.1 hypothetical protein RCG18_23740 [Clostridium sp. OS1-26]